MAIRQTKGVQRGVGKTRCSSLYVKTPCPNCGRYKRIENDKGRRKCSKCKTIIDEDEDVVRYIEQQTKGSR